MTYNSTCDHLDTALAHYAIVYRYSGALDGKPGELQANSHKRGHIPGTGNVLS